MLRVFEGRSLLFWNITSIFLVGVLGIVDYLTGIEYSFYLFYLIPISLSAWFASRTLGLLISFLSVITWGLVDIASGEDFSHPVVYFWNTLIRVVFFVIVTYLISELHDTQKSVQALARTDYVTGVVNTRYFHELLGTELNRSNRYKRPFTLAYLDLDNFKQVNDKFGHHEGDELIAFFSVELKNLLRETDIIARLGGDEFAILFPETDRHEAEIVITKIYGYLKERLVYKYPFVTFSAGVVTYLVTPHSTDETINVADQLMYSVKSSTKNGIKYSLFTG